MKCAGGARAEVLAPCSVIDKTNLNEEFNRVLRGDMANEVEYGSESIERLTKAEEGLVAPDDLVICGSLLGLPLHGGGPYIAGVISVLERQASNGIPYQLSRVAGSGLGALYGAGCVLGLKTKDLMRMHFAWYHLRQNKRILEESKLLETAMKALFPRDAHETAKNRLFVTLYSGVVPSARIVSTYFDLEDLIQTVVAAVVGTWAHPVRWRGQQVYGCPWTTPLFTDNARDQLVVCPTSPTDGFNRDSFEREALAGQTDTAKFLRGIVNRETGVFLVQRGASKFWLQHRPKLWLLSRILRRVWRSHYKFLLLVCFVFFRTRQKWMKVLRYIADTLSRRLSM